MRRIVPIALALWFLAPGCGDDDSVTTVDPFDDDNGSVAEPSDAASIFDEWVLVAGPVPDPALAGVTTLRIDADGSAGGSTACNSYFTGGRAVEGDRWVATTFGVTEMGCEPERMEAQSVYLDMLATTATFEVTDTTLELVSADGSTRLSFERVMPS